MFTFEKVVITVVVGSSIQPCIALEKNRLAHSMPTATVATQKSFWGRLSQLTQ